VLSVLRVASLLLVVATLFMLIVIEGLQKSLCNMHVQFMVALMILYLSLVMLPESNLNVMFYVIDFAICLTLFWMIAMCYDFYWRLM